MSTKSRVDNAHFQIWTFSIVCNLIVFVNLVIFVLVSHFPGQGFPCNYYHVVDLTNLNMTQYNVIHHLTPQLFLTGGQMIAYVIQTLVVFGFLCGYFVFCWFKLLTCTDPGPEHHVNQKTRDIGTIGDSTSSFLFTLAMLAFQFFIMTLTYRLPVLVSFTCAIFFIVFTILTIRMVTQYKSANDTVLALSKLHPNLQGTMKLKTFMMNTLDCTMPLNGIVLALSLGLALGNSFYVTSATIVFFAMNFFATMLLIYFILIETLLHYYMKVNFGFHTGTAFAIAVLAYPIVMYETIYASEYSMAVSINLAAIALLWLVFFVTRLVRFFLRQRRRYRLLPSADEVKRLTEDSPTVT